MQLSQGDSTNMSKAIACIENMHDECLNVVEKTGSDCSCRCHQDYAFPCDLCPRMIKKGDKVITDNDGYYHRECWVLKRKNEMFDIARLLRGDKI
jgi:hypothetical protein